MKALRVNARLLSALGLGVLASLALLWLLGHGSPVIQAQGPDGYSTYHVALSCAGVPAPCYTSVQAAVDAADDPEIDLLEALSRLMGWRQPGVRVTVEVADAKGQLARVATAIAKAGGLLTGGGSYASAEPLKARIVFRVRGIPRNELEALLRGLENVKVLDVRESHSGAP